MAADKQGRSDQILFGSTLMRQHHYIFDLDNGRIGVARAQCNNDPQMIRDEQEMIENGFDFGLSKIGKET